MRQFFVKKNFHDKLKVGISLVVGERGGHFTKHLLDALVNNYVRVETNTSRSCSRAEETPR